MSKGRDRTTSPLDDGRWSNRRNDATRPSSIHSTQREAQSAARKHLKNQAGGELTTQKKKGQFRDQDTVAPGNDAEPLKGYVSKRNSIQVRFLSLQGKDSVGVPVDLKKSVVDRGREAKIEIPGKGPETILIAITGLDHLLERH